MRQQLKCDIRITTVHSGVDIVTIDVMSLDASRWCAELCLLSKGIVDSIELYSTCGDLLLKFRINTHLAIETRGKILNRNQNMITIEVTATELEMWLFTFLKYYRNGIGDVDHFDLDIVGDPRIPMHSLFVVFKGISSNTPLTPDEAAKRLHMKW